MDVCSATIDQCPQELAVHFSLLSCNQERHRCCATCKCQTRARFGKEEAYQLPSKSEQRNYFRSTGRTTFISLHELCTLCFARFSVSPTFLRANFWWIAPISLFIFFGLMCNFFLKPRGDQTENHSTKSVTRRQQKRITEEDFANVNTELSCMQHALVIRWTELKTWYLRGLERSISNTETKACSWAETQVAVGLWVGMYGCFSLSTNQKARELC